MTSRRVARRAVADELLDPTPRATQGSRPAPIRLMTPDDIRVEMAKVYRAAKRGDVDSQIATRLVYILGELRKAYELSVIERRLQALELEVDT